MYNKKILVLLLISISLLANPSIIFARRPFYPRIYPRVTAHATISPTTTLKAFLIGGIAAATCYGCYRLYSWLFEQSDEKLLEHAHNACQEAQARYDSMYKLLTNTYPSYNNNNDIIYNFTESVLYQLGVEKHYDASIDNYLRRLISSIKTLEGYKSKLTQRIPLIYTTVHTDSTKAWIYDHMQALLQKITTIMPTLSLLRDYLTHHRSYFILFEFESSLLYRYNQELNCLHTFSFESPKLTEVVRRCIMMHHNYTQHRYPFISYVDMISRDIDTLHEAIARLAYNYAERIYYAQDLYQKLTIMKGIVISANEYHTELIEQEKAHLKEAELAIQQQQLHAMQQQNYLYEQELRLQEQQCNQPYTHITEIYVE